MVTALEGKIAQILSESVVVINIGAMQGCRPGMVFVILAEGDDVTDPDSGETLGKWELPKGQLRAAHVQEKISVCEAIQVHEKKDEGVDPSTLTLSASMIAVSMPGQRKSAKLNVRQADIAGMPDIPPVKVGDKVRSLTEAT